MKKDFKLDVRVSQEHLEKLKNAADKATKKENIFVSQSELVRRFIDGLK